MTGRFLVIAISFLVGIISFAKVRFVPGEYKTIQSAINASAPGDTILVDEGIYFENLVLRKNIVLAGKYILNRDSSLIARTIIDGSSGTDPARSSAILILPPADSNCVITGFTVQGGRGTYGFVPLSPEPNKWIFGGGIAVLNAGARISNNIVRRNRFTGNLLAENTFGCGIGTLDTSFGRNYPPLVIIEDNLIIENSGDGERSEAGGIFADQPAIIRYNKVLYNSVKSRSRSSGGGIGANCNAEYKIYIYGNYIGHNSAGIGGGMYIGTGKGRVGLASVSNNIIADNKSFEAGGGVLLSNEANAVFINNTIVKNITLSTGGAFFVARGSYAVLVNNIIWDNKPDQIANLSTIQSFNNLVQGGFTGRGNFDDNPAFIPGDTLFRLTGQSPCLSAGRKKILIAGKELKVLPLDLLRMPRSNPEDTNPDLGAVESPYSDPDQTEQLHYDGTNIRLFLSLRQLTPTLRDNNTGELLKAGEMRAYMIVNEEKNYEIRREEDYSFELPPGENLLDLEIIARGRDSVKSLNLYVSLEGADQQVLPYNSAQRIFYHHWANLKPGDYILRIQPQDDESIIGATNRYAFAVTVLPYWYQRWWAYLLYSLAVIAIAFVYTRLRVRGLEKDQALKLQNLEINKLAELDKLKSRFFANVTHELRTPLTLILGPADTLLSEIKDKKYRELISLIRRNGFRLARLVEMLLQFSKVEAGVLKLQVVYADIIPVLTRVVGYFASPAAKKNVELSFLPQKASISGYFDEEKVEHIVQNLLSNALKFTKSGGRIAVEVTEKNQVLTIRVSDTGIGIPPEHLGRIFERFYRIENSHKEEGTGIGLSLTKELIDSHHGTISVESKAGEGTVFTVTIPLSGYSEAETGNAPPAERLLLKPESESVRTEVSQHIEAGYDRLIILVAEDNDDAREYIASVLRDKYEIMLAQDGAKALEQTRINLPDLVISDVMMPDMDGYELCRILKSDEKTCHIPVILLTALADKKERLNGLEQGADDYLTKPFDKQELLARIHNLLELRKKLREAFSHTEKLKPGDVPVHSLNDKFLNRVRQTAEKHIAEEGFSVDQFAHEVFMSRMQFYRKLKAVTNLTPNDFLKIIRLERAKQLLTEDYGSIAEVSEAVGFGNPSYFARCYQEHFGILPHEVHKSKNN